MSLPESRESSPRVQKSDLDVPAPSAPAIENPFSRTEDDDDFDDLEETIVERLWGLTEMFPESLRNKTCSLFWGSISGAKRFYGVSRGVLWVLFSSSAILFAPVIFETERLQVEEMSRQQQRQILLGPSAAVSGGAPGMPGLSMMPQPQR